MTDRVPILAIFVCFNFLFFNLLMGQEYSFVSYSIQQGLPQSQVYAIVEDSKGYIWLGTHGGGVSRFDGRKFKNFSKIDGLPSNYIESFVEDDLGRLWVGTNKGLALLNGDRFEAFEKKDFEKPCYDLVVTKENRLLLGTDRGIYEFDLRDTSFRRLTLGKGVNSQRINKLYRSADRLYAATNFGVWRIDEKPVNLFLFNDLPSENVNDVLLDEKGRLWCLTNNKIIYFGSRSDRLIGNSDLDFTQKANCFYQQEDGSVWVGTQDRGLAIFSPNTSSWMIIDESKGLANNNVQAIAHDGWGNQWIGTSGGGLVKYLGQFFIHYKDRLGVGSNRIYALHQGADRLWFSNSEKGIYYLDSLGFHRFKRDSNYLKVKCKTILEDEDGRLWVGTEGKGVAVFDSSGMRMITQEERLPSNWIGGIVQRQDTFWIATYANGICQLFFTDSVNIGIKHLNRYFTKLPYAITNMVKSPSGHIWFSAKGGSLGYFDQRGRVINLGQSDGLPGSELFSIAFDSLNNVLVGTAGDGLFAASLNDLKFMELTLPSRLSSENIYLTIADANGHLWVGTERGVDQLIRNRAGVVEEVVSYGVEEGFLGIETCRNAVLSDYESNLWFGTMNGLMKHKLSDANVEKVPPKLHFERVYINNKPLDTLHYLNNHLRLRYYENRLGFNFQGIDFYDPNLLKYRWKLTGVDKDWSELTSTQSVFYPKLSAGWYTFQVEACNTDGRCSERVVVDFNIEYPFWEKGWFRIAFILSLGLAIVLSLLRYVNGIKRKEAKKREKLEMRNRVLELEQKALQLQMNPHFIFNALNSIQSLIVTNKNKEARKEINTFALLIRSILHNSRNQRISLADEMKTLMKYLEVEQFCQEHAFDFEIVDDVGMDPAELSLPPMLIQPFVENALIHGIHKLPRRGKIKLRFFLEDHILVSEVIDNGRGRTAANARKQIGKNKHESVATLVTEERLRALKGKANYEALEIEDLYDLEQPTGTKVVLRIPVEINF